VPARPLDVALRDELGTGGNDIDAHIAWAEPLVLLARMPSPALEAIESERELVPGHGDREVQILGRPDTGPVTVDRTGADEHKAPILPPHAHEGS
jgi:hypothetical protein